MRAVQIREQLSSLLKKFNINVEVSSQDKTEPILKCLAVSFFMNGARTHYDGDYRHLKSGIILKVHPNSVMNLLLANVDQPPPKFIIYNDVKA